MSRKKYVPVTKAPHPPTPPPWLLRETHGQYEIVASAREGHAEHLVATVCCSGVSRTQGRCNQVCRKEALANAQEIAKAAERTEALRRAVAYLDGLPTSHRTGRVEAIVRQGRAALSDDAADIMWSDRSLAPTADLRPHKERSDG